MKKITILLLSAVFVSQMAFAQTVSADKVPAAVTSAFKTKFPAAANTTWQMKSGKTYEASFKVNNDTVTATFDQAGKWQETETALKTTALPAAVQSTLSKDFTGYKINEASKIEQAQKGSCYEAEIARGTEMYDVQLSPEGKMLSKTKVPAEKTTKG
jgi:hypothetical protein